MPDDDKPSVWRLAFEAPSKHLGGYEMAMEPLEGAVVTGGESEAGFTPVQVYVTRYVDQEEGQELLHNAQGLLNNVTGVFGDAMPDIKLEKLPDVNWVAESQKALPPILAGRFYVYGSHVKDPPPAGSVPLLIEANVAFGTGQHDTTKGCLLTMSDLAELFQASRVLDMGTGSGILAMAARHLWNGAAVVGVDIDEASVRVARENAELNRISAVEFVVGDGYQTPLTRNPFDLVVANILAEPLCRMAPALDAALCDGGYAVLSGLLITQQDEVVEAHKKQGLLLEHQCHLGEWATLLFKKA